MTTAEAVAKATTKATMTRRTGRRGNHEGSITQLADGRWQARVTLESGTRKAYYGKTRAEAATKLNAALRNQHRGLPIVGEKQTLQEYLTHWLEIAKQHLRPRSYIRYEEAIRLHIIPTLGRVPLARLTAQHLQRLYSAKLAEGQAPASVARLHAVIRRALNEAMRLDLIPRNPATLVTAPRQPRTEQQVLTPEQVRVLLAAIEGHPLQAFFTLLAMTGMRRGEALALHWTDVHLDEGFADVKYTLEHTKGGGHTFAPPKTEHSRRRAPLNRTAVAALKQHRTKQLEQRLAAGDVWQDEDLVFTDVAGRALRGNHILQRQFAPLLKQAGLPAIRLHDLRHTAASLLAHQGVHVTAVSRLLGHSSTSMTLDIYSHVFPDAQRNATATLDGLVGMPDDQEGSKGQNSAGN
jgi:integrase